MLSKIVMATTQQRQTAPSESLPVRPQTGLQRYHKSAEVMRHQKIQKINKKQKNPLDLHKKKTQKQSGIK